MVGDYVESIEYSPESVWTLGWAGFNEIFENGPPLASGRGLCEIDRV